MMELSDYTQYDATGLAELIRAGQVSAQEVQDAAASAIDKVDPQLHAVAGARFAEPLGYSSGGPFGGVPFAIKDLILHAEGIPQRAGTRLLGPGVPYPYDTFLMARFRRAGLAAMTVTTTPEFGFNAATEAVAYGAPTANPWDVSRSPGGSSGGSAALVAAGALPVAHANDGGGSIRIPASASGLVGLKPTRGRVTTGPDYGDPLLGMGIEFAVTRTVRDCAGLLDALHGAEPGDPHLLPIPERPYAQEVERGSRPLRIAMSCTPLDERRSVDPQSIAAVRSVAQTLTDLGHHVEEAAPVVDGLAFDKANLDAWCSFLADGALGAAAALGVELGPDVVERTTLACVEYGRTLSALDIYAIQRVFNTITRDVSSFLTEYDVILTPTTAFPNTALGHLDANAPDLDAKGWYDHIFEFAAFTALFNATGHPALSLPLAESTEGWPIGVQIAGRYGDESTLIALAGDLERARPWSARRPAVWAG